MTCVSRRRSPWAGGGAARHGNRRLDVGNNYHPEALSCQRIIGSGKASSSETEGYAALSCTFRRRGGWTRQSPAGIFHARPGDARAFFPEMAPYPRGKGEVCKTFMHRFDSGRRLCARMGCEPAGQAGLPSVGPVGACVLAWGASRPNNPAALRARALLWAREARSTFRCAPQASAARGLGVAPPSIRRPSTSHCSFSLATH